MPTLDFKGKAFVYSHHLTVLRTLYVDLGTTMRLAQYGEEHCGLRWKGRPKELI